MQSELKPADVWLLNYASRCVTAVEQATTASTTSKAKLVANILRQLVDEKDAIIDALCMENSEYCEALHTRPTASNELVDKLLMLETKATPAPWGIWFEQINGQKDKAINELIEQVHATDPVGDSLVMLDAEGKCPAITGCGPASANNAALIVWLRNHVPDIIAALSSIHADSNLQKTQIAPDVLEEVREALEKAAGWFNGYAESHADKMVAAEPFSREQASRAEKAKRNIERRDYLNAALSRLSAMPSGWRPIETADLTKLFANNEPILIYTSDGRVTQARAYFHDANNFTWSCASGDNVADPCFPTEYLRHKALYWQPLPTPPEGEE